MRGFVGKWSAVTHFQPHFTLPLRPILSIVGVRHLHWNHLSKFPVTLCQEGSLRTHSHPQANSSISFARKLFQVRTVSVNRAIARQLLQSRAVSVNSAMAKDFQPQLARQPPAELPPQPPNGGKYKIAACQILVTADKEANIAHTRSVIEAAADKGARLILLPEMWNCPYSNDSFPMYAENIDAGYEASPSSAMLAEVARTKEVTIIGGSIPERSNGLLYNTCCIFDKDGELKAKHRKVHLFDIDIPGKITFKESETLNPGEGLTVVDTDVGRIAVGICYDIRFPEMAMLYAARGAHIICYPGAFNMTTGPLHWELLQKASTQQIDAFVKVFLEESGKPKLTAYVKSCGQSGEIRTIGDRVPMIYVVTCSPARNPSAGYIAWGHSTVVGPFGEILATTEHEEATIFANIDYSEIDQRRLNMPLGNQRRGDLYRLIDVPRGSSHC